MAPHLWGLVVTAIVTLFGGKMCFYIKFHYEWIQLISYIYIGYVTQGQQHTSCIGLLKSESVGALTDLETHNLSESDRQRLRQYIIEWESTKKTDWGKHPSIGVWVSAESGSQRAGGWNCDNSTMLGSGRPALPFSSRYKKDICETDFWEKEWKNVEHRGNGRENWGKRVKYTVLILCK